MNKSMDQKLLKIVCIVFIDFAYEIDDNNHRC